MYFPFYKQARRQQLSPLSENASYNSNIWTSKQIQAYIDKHSMLIMINASVLETRPFILHLVFGLIVGIGFLLKIVWDIYNI